MNCDSWTELALTVLARKLTLADPRVRTTMFVYLLKTRRCHKDSNVKPVAQAGSHHYDLFSAAV